MDTISENRNHERPPESEGNKRRKKPRWNKVKKKEAALAREQLQQKAPQVLKKPGKKRLRKMRYQQRTLSQAEYLVVVAKNVAFTGAVHLSESEHEHNNKEDCKQGDAGSSREENEQKDDISACTRTVQITTTTGTTVPPTTDQHGRTNSLNTRGPDLIQIKPLLVLDLNGILCHRVRLQKRESFHGSDVIKSSEAEMRPSIAVVAQTPVVPRDDLIQFLTFLDRHFCLAVWTSAKPKTANALVKLLFPPEMASRLLFVWTQTHCNQLEKGAVGRTTSTTAMIDHKKPADEDDLMSSCQSSPLSSSCVDEAVFEKDLSKVWKEFPLWNSNNTLLMDDSPEKVCWTHGQTNAVHPPALNGFTSDWVQQANGKALSSSTIQFTSDEENQRKQQSFYNGLVDFWTDHSFVQRWIGDNEVANTMMMMEREAKPGDSSSDCQNDGLIQYLRHAKELKGWK